MEFLNAAVSRTLLSSLACRGDIARSDKRPLFAATLRMHW
jgi:hypothetical protein